MNDTITADVELAVRSYVDDSYWKETFDYIEITKKSGMNRARTEANRNKALEEYLRSIGRSLEWFMELEKKTKQKFHYNEDGFIVIPAHKMAAAMVNAVMNMPAAMRPCNPDLVRKAIDFSDFVTDRTSEDGVFDRFVVTTTAGGGIRASNQRSRRQNAYIKDFTATGTLEFDDVFVKPETLHAALEFCGRNIGVGSSRKMGYGSFTVSRFDVKK